MRRYTYTKIRDCNSARDRLPAYGRLGESQLKGLLRRNSQDNGIQKVTMLIAEGKQVGKA